MNCWPESNQFKDLIWYRVEIGFTFGWVPHDGRITLWKGGVYQHISKPTGINHSSMNWSYLWTLDFYYTSLGYSHIGRRLPSDVLKNWKLIEFQKKLNQGGNCWFSGIFILQTFVGRGKIRRSQLQYFLSNFFPYLSLYVLNRLVLNCNSLVHFNKNQSFDQLLII